MKKILIILGILATFVILSGCVQQPQIVTQYICSDGTTVADKTLCPAAKIADETKTAAPEVEETTLESQLAVCYGMPSTQSGSLEDICIIGLAGKLKDTSLCKKLAKDQRMTCYVLVGGVKKDPDVCLEAEFQEDECYNKYATEKKDASVCEKIKEANYKSNCYQSVANYTGDPALCDKITMINSKDYCYRDMANKFQDITYCNKVTTANLKQECLQNLQNMQGGSKPVMEMPAGK
ncbi:MAG: hypothetical protein COT15_03015 [Candidatus Diapherotrites archaeon CG08_land_8_20_14_0_20_34_12]|nr:MAG: hypothetical protein COT15_03015 [Candidatus Diapherotrites archaeon CG08_land_8_20_14_0_20_34_12]